jgi:EAL domain-containing protein (putative c-di-GMP-specific phosphodiesterase class I)/ActR/RegA family two-component response regulator
MANSNLRTLLVDDDELLLDLMSANVKDYGVGEVMIATNGAQALSMLVGGQHFDVILTDLNMPQMDGIELMRHLAQLRYTGGIILLTGEDVKVLQTANKLAEAHRLRLLGVLQKPVSRAALGALLSQVEQTATDMSPPNLDPGISSDDLSTAIRGGQIFPYFQPRVSVSDRRVVGVEALARWWHPGKGMIMPSFFIPLAEQAGLISELSQVMLKAAIEQLGTWRVNGLKLKLSVNVTTDDLRDISLPDRLIAWCRAANVSPSDITLELTETQLMSKLERTLDTLIRLRLKGVSLAVDDFGTGYSNLGQIKRAPFSELKIDRSFVNDGVQDEEGRTILSATIVMGRQLGLTVVAEGVESEAEWDAVCSMGADEVQGYWVAAPMPAADLPRWVVEWSRESTHCSA